MNWLSIHPNMHIEVLKEEMFFHLYASIISLIHILYLCAQMVHFMSK
jgi:hypothetical protein